MNRAGDDDIDADLEVIELEPEESQPRDDRAAVTPPTRSRAPLVIAVVVVAALVVSTVAGRTHHANRTTSTTLPTARPNPQLFPFRVGAQILTGGLNGLLAVDTDTGAVTVPRISGLPGGPVTIVAHSGATVAVRVGATLYWFSLATRHAHATNATGAFPAARTGSLWMTSKRWAILVPGAPDGVPTNGRAIGATNAGLIVPTKAGVFVQPAVHTTSSDARLLLKAPARVIGIHGDRVAWLANECGVLRCPVHVTEIATGATSTWLQLVGHPTPLMVAGTTALFSPNGAQIAIVVPDANVIGAQTFIVADLRSRTISVVNTVQRFDEPARPGSNDATGSTATWTLDGRFLLLAPASGTGPIGVIDPHTTGIISSRAPLGIISSIAAVGVSKSGTISHRPLDEEPPVDTRRIDTGGPTRVGTAALQLVGIDDRQVDALDLHTGASHTWVVDGIVPNPAGQNTIARVAGGWLVVRGSVVDLLTIHAGTPKLTFVDAGSQVFSADGGRSAWIAIEGAGLAWRVEPYDPVTATIGLPRDAGFPVGATAKGLLVTGDAIFRGSEFDFVDRLGTSRRGPLIDTRAITVLAAAGTHVAFLAPGGLYLLDLTTDTDRLITPRALNQVALSPDGRALAWLEIDPNAPTLNRVYATRVDGKTVASLGGPADRVLVADDGTVLFTRGSAVRRGGVDADGSATVYGLAPDPDATLALG